MKSLTWLKYELKNMLTDYKVLCTIFVGPMIFLLFVSYLISPFLIEDRHFEKIDLALVNLDDSTITEMIIQHFLNDEGVEKYVNVLQVNEQEAEQLIKNNQVASTVIIPERFSADLSVGINTPVTVIGNQKQPLQAAMIKMLMESGANMVTASQAGINTVYSYMQKIETSPEELNAIFQDSVIKFTLHSLGRNEIWIKQTSSPYGDLTMQQYYLVNMGILFVFFMSLLGVKISTNESVRLEKRLLTFGLSSFHYLFVRFFSLSLFIAFPFTAYFAAFSWVMRDSFAGNLSHIVIIGIFLILFFSTIFIVISTIFRNIGTVNLVSIIVIILIAVLGGTFIPLTFLPSYVGEFQFLSITYWLSQGLYLAYFHKNDPLFWKTVVVLCLFIAIHLSFAKVFYQKHRGVK